MKNIKSEVYFSPDGLKNRLDTPEINMSQSKDSEIETIQVETQRLKN